MTAREWVQRRLMQYGVRAEARALILERTTFTIADWDSTAGGGLTRSWENSTLVEIELDTAQHEACIHECAHAWRVLVMRLEPERWERMRVRLIRAMMRQSELPPGDFPRIRKLCRDYRWGVGDWPGMQRDDGTWNDSEIWAGLCSGCMGGMHIVPPDLRHYLLDQFFGWELVHLPNVTAYVVHVP
jgi:hypothetical protein